MKKSKNIDFSVIVCCYNPNLEKLKKTIISIEKQKGILFEVIISDDGSKNKYQSEIKLWAEALGFKNLKYNFLQDNVGTVKNLISGIEISEGKYIKTISPGDYLFNEETLFKYKQIFDKNNYDIIGTDAVYYNDNGSVYNIKRPKMRSSRNKKKIKRNFCFFNDRFCGATLSFKRDMVKYLYEISTVVKYTEDFPLVYLSLLNNKRGGFFNEYMVWYEYGTGISSKSQFLVDNDINNFFKYLQDGHIEDKKQIKAIKFINLIRRKKILKAILINPLYFFEKLDEKLFFSFSHKKQVNFELINKITRIDF